MQTLTVPVTHVIVSSNKSFDQVAEAVESMAKAGKIDLAVVEQIVLASRSWDDFREKIESKVGISSLMTFTEIDHGSLMSLAFEGVKAKLYVIGNPLIAKQMLEHNLGVGLNTSRLSLESGKMTIFLKGQVKSEVHLKEFSFISPVIESAEVFSAIETAIPPDAIAEVVGKTDSQEERSA